MYKWTNAEAKRTRIAIGALSYIVHIPSTIYISFTWAPSCIQVHPAEGFRARRARPRRSFSPVAHVDSRPTCPLLIFRAAFGFRCSAFAAVSLVRIVGYRFVFLLVFRRWFFLSARRFRLSKLLFSFWYWSRGAGFGRSVGAAVSLLVMVWCWYWSFGGRSLCAADSFHLFLWSAGS